MHLVETMAYAGERPWHGFGNRLAPQQPIEVWKRQAGMDWKIEEAEVRYVAGNQNLGVIHVFPEQKVLYRSDNRRPWVLHRGTPARVLCGRWPTLTSVPVCADQSAG